MIIDLYSRKVIAYKLSSKIDKLLVIDTLKLAYKNRHCPNGVLFHSDRGSQYTSMDVRILLDEIHFVQSYSKKGYPYDNAVVESFFKYLKKEEIKRYKYQSVKQLEISLFDYIEGFYNSKRPHGYNNGLSPNQKEEKYLKG